MTPWPFAGSSWKEPDRPSTPTTGSLPIGHGLASAGVERWEARLPKLGEIRMWPIG
jgi:hypothetical protein